MESGFNRGHCIVLLLNAGVLYYYTFRSHDFTNKKKKKARSEYLPSLLLFDHSWLADWANDWVGQLDLMV